MRTTHAAVTLVALLHSSLLLLTPLPVRAQNSFIPDPGTLARLFPDAEKLVFCDNVEIQATQKGVRVELLLQPFGLVCVMADMASGGTLGRYMEDGLVSWRLDTDERLSGMGLGDVSFSEVPHFFSSVSDRLSSLSLTHTDFSSAFTSTVMGLSIDTPMDVASTELAHRLSSLTEIDSPDQFTVLSAIMGLEAGRTAREVEAVLVERFKHPEALKQEVRRVQSGGGGGGGEGGGVKRAEESHSTPPPPHMVSLNMMSDTGRYVKPMGDFIFPDRAMTSLVGEGERRRQGGGGGGASAQQQGVRVRGPLENLMPFY